jgi:hypothetical protein
MSKLLRKEHPRHFVLSQTLLPNARFDSTG